MSDVTIQLPASVRTEIKKQAAERRQIVLPEDRDAFLMGIEPEHQAEAEHAWNQVVQANEDRDLERERRFRVRDNDGAQARRNPYFLTVPQVASRWNMSERSVWRMVRDGRLASRLIGTSRRVLEEDVEQFESADMAVA